MKNIRLLTLLLLAALFSFSSCGDKDEDPKPKTNKELITAKTWKVSRIMGDGLDISSEADVAFIKNSRTKFNADGTYSQTTTSYIESGIWEFSGNETGLVFDPNTDEEENWDITKLEDGSLKMRTTFIYEYEDGEIETMLLELELVHAE